jgi:hypothetical protein
MKRFLAILTAASLAAALSAGSVLAAKPVADAYGAKLTVSGKCVITLIATWPSTDAVDTVYGTWYLDGAYTVSTQAPGTGPNAGTFDAATRTATFTFALTRSGGPHTWRVLTQFYGGGAQLQSMDSNTVSSRCAF